MTGIYNDTATSFSGSSNGSSSLTAFFDNRADAESAISRLESAGVPVARIRMVPGYEGDGENGLGDDHSGFFEALADFFFPDEDRKVYSEGLRRGGLLVSVSDIDDASYETVHDILADEGSIDMDERADSWRSEGWTEVGSNTGFAGSTNGGLASEDVAVSEESVEQPTSPSAAKISVSGERDATHGSNKVRAHTFFSAGDENSSSSQQSSSDPDRSQAQTQTLFGQSQPLRRDH